MVINNLQTFSSTIILYFRHGSDIALCLVLFGVMFAMGWLGHYVFARYYGRRNATPPNHSVAPGQNNVPQYYPYYLPQEFSFTQHQTPTPFSARMIMDKLSDIERQI